MLNDLTEAAVEAAERGWAVFPCRPGTRLPAVPWVREEAWSSDPDYVRENWWPGYNIGVALKHSGLLVIDPDRHPGGQDGVKAFNLLVDEHEADRDWPDTLTVATPRNGYHLYFQNPDGLACSSGILPEGIDVKGAGGLVLAPGSEIDGRAYRVENEAEILPLPEWLEEMITTPRREPQRRGYAPRYRSHQTRRRQAEKIIADLLENAIEGERNNYLHWAACRMHELGFEEEAEDGLLEAARQIGLGEAESIATIKSAFRPA